jgi:iron(III) transport system substrate-binding protein
MTIRRIAGLWLGGMLCLLAGCGGVRDRGGVPARSQVVVYSSQDREFGEPILRGYAQRSGVEVLRKFDVESTTTVGLANDIIAEMSRPRCDLFWNNEILNTLRL